MDKWEEINQRLENAMLVTSHIQDRHAAGLKDHREWLEDPTRVANEHQQRMADHERSMADHDRRMEAHERWMERHELTVQAIDERLEQISIKVDRIAELIFKDALRTVTNRDDPPGRSCRQAVELPIQSAL